MVESVDMDVQPDIAPVAALFADRSRARMLLELLDGTARPVTRLAQVAQISTSTASEHLAKLAQGDLVQVEQEGRVRRYRLTTPHVAVALESLIPLADTPTPTGLRAVNAWDRLRVARSCYDHLAGTLGTDILAGLLDTDVLVRDDQTAGTVRGDRDPSAGPSLTRYVVGPRGHAAFQELNIDLTQLEHQRRPLIRACTDWTEQRHHLAGSLGAALRTAMITKNWITPRPGRRDITVNHPDKINDWLTRC